jgi:hypothetical protein
MSQHKAIAPGTGAQFFKSDFAPRPNANLWSVRKQAAYFREVFGRELLAALA